MTDKYEKTRLLGEGGMGQVWLARDTELDRWVALKFLKIQDDDEIARFRREAQVAARLNHPNIGAVYEATDQYIALQFVDGQTLGTFPRDDRRLLVSFLRDAALAVHAAHEQGVIHRDLKPDNLMVESNTRRLFVMDFGLAKSMSVDAALSASGLIVGTPSYMSPEQACGRELDRRADVYSLGATVYELLSDRPPFRGSDVFGILKKIVESDPPPPRGDRDLQTIVMKCLEKDPARRYPTAKALAEDLARWLSGEAILAHPPSTFYRMRKFAGRRKALLGVALAGVLAVAATLAILVPRWLAESRARKAEAQAAREREEALKRLNDLRTRLVQAREWTRQEFRKPEEIRALLERTLAELDAYVAAHPDQPQGYYVRAEAQMRMWDLDRAEEDLNRAVGIEPEFGPGWAMLGRVRMERLIQQLYRLSIEKGEGELPDFGLAQEAFARAEEGSDITRWGLSKTEDDLVAEFEMLALRLRFEGRNREAIDVLCRAHAKSRSEESARWLGSLATGEESGRWYREAVAIAPHHAWARFDWAVFLSNHGERAQAIAEYTRAIEIHPGFAFAYVNRSAEYLKRGDWNAARADAEEAVRLDSGSLSVRMNSAWVRMTIQDYDGAFSDLDEAARINPTSVHPWILRAQIYWLRNELNENLRCMNEAVRLAPRSARTRLARSVTYSRLGDLDAALRDCNDALALDPALADGYMYRGKVWILKGDFQAARKDLDEAIARKPDLAQAYLDRAILRESSDDWLADCDAALAINPRFADAYAYRAEGWLRKQDSARAISDCEKALEIAPPEWPLRARTLALLKKLKS